MRIVATLLFAAACSQPPSLGGQVVDIWGHPVQGATVLMVGQSERPLTDAEGRYTLPRAEGTFLVKAGKEGYIQDHQEVNLTAEDTSGPLFRLYPKPSKPGYYLVGTGQYAELEPQIVHNVGNELRSFRGVKTVGSARAEGSELRVLLHTELKYDEILRLGLELHKLEFVREADLQGPLSIQEVTVNLYASQGRVPLEIVPLRSPTDYLITSKEPLTSGFYAFQTQDLLDTEDLAKFAQIPEGLRVVHPFEVR